MPELLLSPAEARVIACLVEKSLTTPQYYPMTVNAIMMAANQKTSRRPVLNLTEGEVGAALNRLEQEKLCSRDDSSRATKWKHRFQTQMLLKPATQALLVTLMLRGPQTGSELRSNASALGGPAEGEGFDAAINDLGDRAQPLVTLLPRSPGQSSQRYAHLLSGAPEIPEDEPVAVSSSGGSGRMQMLEERIAALEARVAELEQSNKD